jgi:predicted enzyme related to lactoylglutathione lyase
MQYDGLRFQVGFEVVDIEAAHQTLIARGVEPITEIFPDETSPWAYFRDPEGNVFAIKQRVNTVEGSAPPPLGELKMT